MFARMAHRGGGFAAPALGAPRPDAGLPAARAGRRALRVYFIRPSRYDDDGRVLAFRWGVIPNNTLTALAGLNAAWAAAHPELELQTVLWDELVDGVLTAAVIDSIAAGAVADGVEAIIGLAGVQTNQYPRGRDLALQFRRRGLPVLMGGFHVTSHPPSADFLIGAGLTVVLGEADDTWPRILADYLHGALQPRYRVEAGMRVRTGRDDITVPAIGAAPLPAIDDRYVRRFFNPTFSTLDTSRGCPFTCSYCSVKNVMGRSMRSRDAEAVVAWVRDAYDRHGIRNLLVVDDDFYRSPRWEPILAGMADLRRTRPDLACILQIDLEAATHDPQAPAGDGPAARSRRFVELAAAAGCFEVFIGFESFDPANLEQVQKFHNEERQDRRRAAAAPEAAHERVVARYRRVVANWHAAGIGVHSGYIIGLPHDRPGCGRAAARALADIGIDIASFFIHTPFPGTEDYDAARAEGRLTDHDFNAYDSTHVVHAHPRLSAAQLAEEYRDAYRSFFTWRRLGWSLATFHAVAGLPAATRAGMLTQQLYFTYATRRGWHPMIGGIWRQTRTERRRAVSDEDAARAYGIVEGIGTRSSSQSRAPSPFSVRFPS